MEPKETLQILSIVKSNYAKDFRFLSQTDLTLLEKTWIAMFSEDDYQTITLALSRYIATTTENVAPTIGRLKAISVDMSEITDPQTATLQIEKALQNSVYHSKEEFNALSPLCQSVVGSPNQLKEWSFMESEAFTRFVAPRLKKELNLKIQKDKEELSCNPLNKLSDNPKQPQYLTKKWL